MQHSRTLEKIDFTAMGILMVLNAPLNWRPPDGLDGFRKIVCVDGGLGRFLEISPNPVPDYIIGDFDSVDPYLMRRYEKTSKIIKKNNQDESDFLFALKYCLKNIDGIREITVVGALSLSADFSICNLMTALSLPRHVNIKFTDDSQDIYLLKKSLDLDGVMGKTISVIPLSPVENISTRGLKWEYSKQNLPLGFVNGISNIAESDSVNFTLDSGFCLVFVNRTARP